MRRSEVLHLVVTTPGTLRIERGTSLPPVTSAAIPMGYG